MEKIMLELSSSLTTDEKKYSGRPCHCGHVRGLHRLLTWYTIEDEDDTNIGVNPSLCICGCKQYKKMDNLSWMEKAAKDKGLVK